MNAVPLRQVLPPNAYRSDAWFRREQTELFARTWTFAGMEEDWRTGGDYKVVQAGDIPLIVLRDHGGQLRALHNICRHRGAAILEGTGNVGRAITCFYHKWAYGLNGDLVGVPQERAMFGQLDKSCLGLRAGSVAKWRNLIFVHSQADAPSFEKWLDAVPSRVGPHDPEALVEIGDLLYRVRANWKIVIENFIDGYHLTYLHHVSLSDGDFTKLDARGVGRHWTACRPLKPGVTYENKPLPVVAGVPVNFGAGGHVLFPNLAIYETATYWMTFHVIPVDARNCMVNVRMRAMPEALARAHNLQPAVTSLPENIVHAKGPLGLIRVDLSDAHPLQSNNIMKEDVFACEAIQRGLESGSYEVGPLSSYEDCLVFFQQQVRDFVPEVRAEAAE